MEPNTNGAPQTLCSAFHFISQIPHKLQNSIKVNFSDLMKNDQIAPNPERKTLLNEASGTDYDAVLNKQLQAWKNNPNWHDEPPEIKVTIPEGSLCNLNMKFKAGLPPDAIYNIIIDPENKRVFKNIKEVVSRKVLIDEGFRQVVEVEQAAIWRFLWWTGSIAVHVFVDQNRSNHTVKFKQGRTGFMKKFEGCWKIEPLFIDKRQNCNSQNTPESKRLEEYEGRVGSTVSLTQLVQPALVPPPPISWYLRGITTKTTEMLINDLLAETKRLRELNDNYMEHIINKGDDEIKEKDIKERWRLRRRNGRHGSQNENETQETHDPIRTRHVAPVEDLVHLKISKRSSFMQNEGDNSNGEKPTRISISTIPHGDIAEFRDLIRDKSLRNGEKSVFMMTLAGENVGANMEITNPGNQFLATPNVNNNVQNINNSSLQESSCILRDPGIYLDIVSNNKKLDLVNHVDKKESKLKEKPGIKGLDLKLERKPVNQPPVRRRCLRALFMESDSDIEDLGKPRRHGCRLKCEEKREKVEERERERVQGQ